MSNSPAISAVTITLQVSAHAGLSITVPILLEAIRVKLRKIGRPINETDFQLKGEERATA